MADDFDDDFVDQLAALDERLADGDVGPISITNDRLHRGLAALKALRKPKSATVHPTVSDRDLDTPGPGGRSEPPRSFGRFEIIRELGRGGFGVVFLGRDPHLNRLVALKMPHAQAVMDGQLRERFRREARAAAGLNHPNIVAVHEVDEQGPLCVLVSEYCPSITLAQWLARQKSPVDPKVAARFTADLADAMAYAHSQGVTHRDLKPANVLVADRQVPAAKVDPEGDGPPPTLKITDFGLAKVADDGGRITRTGTVMGTPAYMAPEQARGQHDQVDARADVYSLGGILYELLTGRPPFLGESDVDTLKLVCEYEPIPPGQLRPRLPRDLATICLKCLEKHPARRYVGASELNADLNRFLADQPVAARPVGRIERIGRLCRRHPSIASLSMGLAVAIVLGLAGMTREYRRANDERSSAIASSQRSERLFGYAKDSIQQLIDRGHELVHKPATVREGMAILEIGRGHYGQLLREDPADERLRRQATMICRRLALLYGEQANAQAADQAWEEAVQHAEALLEAENSPERRHDYEFTICSWAECLLFAQEYGRLLAVTQRALDMARADLSQWPDDLDNAWWVQGVCLFRGMAARKAGQWAVAEPAFREGLAAVRHARRTTNELKWATPEVNHLNHLSQVLCHTGRQAEGLKLANESVGVARRSFESASHDPALVRGLAGALMYLGRANYLNKNWQATVDTYREANSIFLGQWAFNGVLPGTYFEVCLAVKLIADSLDNLGRPLEAIADLEALLAVPPPGARPGRIDPLPADLFECYAALINLKQALGHVEEAKKLLGIAQGKYSEVVNPSPLHIKADAKLAALARHLQSAAKP